MGSFLLSYTLLINKFILHVSTLTITKDFLVLCYLVPCYLWGIALGSIMLVLNHNYYLVT